MPGYPSDPYRIVHQASHKTRVVLRELEQMIVSLTHPQ